ncbi:galactose mutarotase-like [Onthophagus taurus]|uniref:galactose mutarotase-like n=1 Tax=Onthophagus taurus TaxID=166361 RepID=UPI0039BDD49D
MSKQDVKDDVKPDPSKVDPPEIPKKVDKPKNGSQSKIYVDNKNITLTEDVFGMIQNAKGCREKVFRYTWSNHNKIEVEVITYGARIRSIKMPNKKGVVDDIALGYKDLAGYVYYDTYPFGATLGRVTSYIENSTFVIDGKQYWVSSNEGKHNYNGGITGFDGVIFTPYVDGTKVILSYISPDLDEGFPGTLTVRITFELSTKNEFTINMEASTTKPTLVNLSNLLYFNLAGHQSGPEELYKHTVTINSNCYTIYDENKLPDKLPTGDIQNVVNTEFDFQIPIVLKSCLGVVPDDGFDQNYCVNKGIDQGICFAARALHVPSGRILEVYSNQWGVNFSTGNDFGSGLIKTCPFPYKSSDCLSETDDDVFKILDSIYYIMLNSDEEFNDNGDKSGEDEEKLIGLIGKLTRCKYPKKDLNGNVGEEEMPDFEAEHISKDLQLSYLLEIKEIAKKAVENEVDVETAIYQIMDISQNVDRDVFKSESKNSSKEILAKYTSLMNGTQSKTSNNTINNKRNDSIIMPKRKPKGIIIPNCYKDGRIHGKNDAIYKRHGGIAFRTQNYPNAIYHTNFPNSILRPGETYQHTIVYKFYVQGGNPGKWIKRCC